MTARDVFFLTAAIVLTVTQNISGLLFYRRAGYRLQGTGADTPLCWGLSCSVSRTACVFLCSTESSCLSVSFKPSDGTCLRNTEHFYQFDARVVADSDWDYYGPVGKDVTQGDWILMFRAKSGINIPLMNIWDAVGVAHDSDLTNQDPGLFSMYGDLPSPTHYRTHWLDQWISTEQVRFSLFKNRVEVVKMVFNGSGSSNEDWFAHPRLQQTTWTDLVTSSPKHFSVRGQFFRTFYITQTQSFTDCGNVGWLIILNRPGNRCLFDKISPAPQFLYAPGINAVDFSAGYYDKADILAIFIRRPSS